MWFSKIREQPGDCGGAKGHLNWQKPSPEMPPYPRTSWLFYKLKKLSKSQKPHLSVLLAKILCQTGKSSKRQTVKKLVLQLCRNRNHPQLFFQKAPDFLHCKPTNPHHQLVRCPKESKGQPTKSLSELKPQLKKPKLKSVLIYSL